MFIQFCRVWMLTYTGRCLCLCMQHYVARQSDWWLIMPLSGMLNRDNLAALHGAFLVLCLLLYAVPYD